MKISRTTSLILFYSQNMNIIGFCLFSLFLWRYRHCFRTVHHCINKSDTYSDNICITTLVAMYELYSFVEHTLYSRPVIRAVLFDTQFCLILKTEYNPHYNSTKMNMFSSSYNLLSTYECLRLHFIDFAHVWSWLVQYKNCLKYVLY